MGSSARSLESDAGPVLNWCISIKCVRTTINLDDDVLLAARGLARRDGTSIGAVISKLARKGLKGDPCEDRDGANDGFYGFFPLPKRGRPVTNELVDRLREDGPY